MAVKIFKQYAFLSLDIIFREKMSTGSVWFYHATEARKTRKSCVYVFREIRASAVSKLRQPHLFFTFYIRESIVPAMKKSAIVCAQVYFKPSCWLNEYIPGHCYK